MNRPDPENASREPHAVPLNPETRFALCRLVHISWVAFRGVPVNWNEGLSLRAACEDCGEAALSYSWDLFLVNATGKDREEGTDRVALFAWLSKQLF